MRKLFCESCNKQCCCKTHKEKEVYPVKGEDITIFAKVSYCSECGEQVWDPVYDEQNMEEAFREYRKRHSLLQPGEIKAIREKYKISQVCFGRILGLGDKTIARYETGSIQDVAPNNLILLAKDPNNLEMLLERNPSIISDSERIKLLHTISKLKGESIEEIRYDFCWKPYEILIPKFSFVGVNK